MGQFSALTKARILLRRPLPRVRTYTLVYANIEAMMQDMEMLVRGQRFQYIDGWCQPIVRDMWQLISGNMYAHRIFTVNLGVEWDKTPPDQDEMLGDPQYFHLEGWRDDSTFGFANRMETRSLSVNPTDYK